MKIYRDLYGQVTSFENLWLAHHKAARGERGQPAVAAATGRGGLPNIEAPREGASPPTQKA